jgi:hypothetical protein
MEPVLSEDPWDLGCNTSRFQKSRRALCQVEQAPASFEAEEDAVKIWQIANGMPKGKINAPLQPDYCIPLLQELLQGSQIKATVQRDKEPITWNLNATIDSHTTF